MKKYLIGIIAVIALGGAIWVGYSLLTNCFCIFDEEVPILPGSDRDEHGCIGSAGYSWCEARNECIRPWETYCTATPGKAVNFSCSEGKSIWATFYIGDDAFVDLVLSDGRMMSVPHAVSASGARYAKEDESFVFWNKGDTAFITETDGVETYSNCVLQ